MCALHGGKVPCVQISRLSAHEWQEILDIKMGWRGRRKKSVENWTEKLCVVHYTVYAVVSFSSLNWLEIHCGPHKSGLENAFIFMTCLTQQKIIWIFQLLCPQIHFRPPPPLMRLKTIELQICIQKFLKSWSRPRIMNMFNALWCTLSSSAVGMYFQKSIGKFVEVLLIPEGIKKLSEQLWFRFT